MKLNVYTSNERQLTKMGEITTLYDRIVSINFETISPKKKIIKKEVAYPFCIKKLSKGDIPYRMFRLTHSLLSQDIWSISSYDFYIKLSMCQCLRIAYYNKSLIWQTKEFWQKVYYSIGNYIIAAALGALGTLFILNSSSNNSLSRKPGDQKSKEGRIRIDSLNIIKPGSIYLNNNSQIKNTSSISKNK